MTAFCRFFLMFWALAAALGCHQANGENQEPAMEAPLSDSSEVCSLDDDIAQMLLVGFRGMDLSGNNHIVRDIKDHHIGGVILFEYDAPTGRHHRNIQNPEQVRSLCSQLQALRDEVLLIGIDQEGGNVCRLKSKAGFSPLPSARKMGEGGVDTVRLYAGSTARMLKDLGINLNFAPCVDVDVNPACPVIGRLGRSFSGDAARVALLAEAWIEECGRFGIISCPKHFPGHGSSSGDSHLGLVDVSRSWKPCELEPYKYLVSTGKVQMIMTTHVVNRQLDPSGLPATLSAPILTALLRDSLGYEGVVITDDMGMGAIQNEYGWKEALCLTIDAGADLLCIGNNIGSYNPDIVPQTIAAIRELVSEGRLSADRIHASAERVRRLKSALQ